MKAMQGVNSLLCRRLVNEFDRGLAASVDQFHRNSGAGFMADLRRGCACSA